MPGEPDFTTPTNLAAASLLALAVTLMTRQGPQRWLSIAMLATAFGSVLYSSRTIPVAVAILVPITAVQLQRLLGDRSRSSRMEVFTVGSLFVVALSVLAVIVPQTASHPPPQPAWVDTELRALPAGTPVLNDWAWGGFLMWRYPHLDLVMHGYGDTFTIKELERNADVLDLLPGWDEQVQRLGVAYAILDPDSPLAYALETQAGWVVLEESEAVELLTAPQKTR